MCVCVCVCVCVRACVHVSVEKTEIPLCVSFYRGMWDIGWETVKGQTEEEEEGDVSYSL